MGRLIPTDTIGTPTRWLLVFNRKASSWWTSLVAMGRYKHVRTFGYVASADAYIFYDVQFGRTILAIARGDGARRLMLEWCQDADVLSIPAAPGLSRAFPGIVPMLCTTAVARLVGVRCVARPDALWRECLRNGAIPIGQSSNSPSPARPDAAAAHEDCPAAAGPGATV